MFIFLEDRTDHFIQQLQTIYGGEAKGVTRSVCSDFKKGAHFPMAMLKDKDCITKYILDSRYLSNRRFKINACSFGKKNTSALEDAVNVFALVITLKKPYNCEKSFNYSYIENTIREHNLRAEAGQDGSAIPMPTYVEDDNGELRLVYVLNQPIFLPYRDKQKRADTITWLNRILTELCNKYMKELAIWAKPNKLNTYLKGEGNYYKIYRKDYNKKEKKSFFRFQKFSFVRTYPISTTYSWTDVKTWEIHELSNAILPPLPDWYENWKKKDKDKELPGIHISGTPRVPKELAAFRMNVLEQLQANGYDEGYREHMCFLYWNFALQAGHSMDNARKLTLDFNQKFQNPLEIGEVLGNAQPQKVYRYTNETIIKYLHIPKELADMVGLSEYSKKEYMRKYMRQYRAKKGQAPKESLRLKIAEEAKRLRFQEKMTISAIAKKLGTSESTVKRALTAPT